MVSQRLLFVTGFVMQGLGAAILGVVLAGLYRFYGRPYLRFWSQSCWCFCVYNWAAVVSMTLATVWPNVTEIRVVLAHVASINGYWQLILLLAGYRSLAGHPPARRSVWTLMAAAIPFCAALLFIFPLSVNALTSNSGFFYRQTLRAILAAATYGLLGRYILRLPRRGPAVGQRLVGLGFLAYTVEQLEYISIGMSHLAWPKASFLLDPLVPFCGFVDFTLQTTIGVGMVMWLLEEEREEVLKAAELRAAGERALRDSERRYRSLVQNAPFGICRSASDGRLLAVNPALISMLGYSSDEELFAIGSITEICRHDTDRERLLDQFLKAPSPTVTGVEMEWMRKEKTIVLVRLSGRRVQRPDGEIDGLEMIVEDITQRRTLEAQLRQAQKMEAVGQLAGGIAHDFNNLLTAILGYSELVLAVTPAGNPSRLDLEEICRAAHQAEALTRQLLAFSRKQVFQPTAVDLNEAVEGTERMLGRLIGEHIQLRLKLDPTSGSIYADPTHIEQILMNLAVNARDAMAEGGGVLTLETANLACADAAARALPGGDQRWVMLAVTDTGCGMTPETQARMFEPFFTTKGRGKGTGLGLSTVYGIVLQCGGEIRVTSEVGGGSRFEVFFRPESPAAKVKESPLPNPVRAGTETVLVVEDEPPVRRFVCRVLRQRGFTVIEAADPAEAMRAATDRRCGIDLLLTDVVMPQMSGPTLAGRMRGLCPGLRVLYMSGYAGESLSGSGVAEADKRLLLKPFEAAELLERVRQALDDSLHPPHESIRIFESPIP